MSLKLCPQGLRLASIISNVFVSKPTISNVLVAEVKDLACDSRYTNSTLKHKWSAKTAQRDQLGDGGLLYSEIFVIEYSDHQTTGYTGQTRSATCKHCFFGEMTLQLQRFYAFPHPDFCISTVFQNVVISFVGFADDNVYDNILIWITIRPEQQARIFRQKKAPKYGALKVPVNCTEKQIWWLHRDLNLGHQHYECCALTNWAM